MPRLTPDTLRRALAKGAPASAYYVHGSESILKDEVTALILDAALDPALRDFNLDFASAQQLDPDGLEAVCSTLPMMADRRVVVLRDIEAWKRKTKAKQPAAQYLQRPSPDTVLVIVQGNDDDPDTDLAQHCTTVGCDALSGQALDAWLDGRLEAVGVTLTPDAREHLLRATGADLGILAAEVLKLGGLDVSGPLDLDTVGSLVGVRHGETADDWRDAVLRDDVAHAAAVLPRVLEQSGTSGVALITLMGTSLLVLRWARATAAQRRIRDRALADAVKSFCLSARPRVGSYEPFARLIAEVAPHWSGARCRAAIAAALTADIALKNTTISDDEGIVTDFALTVAGLRERGPMRVPTGSLVDSR